MKSSEIETTIRRAVDKLFVNGAGTEGTRLVLIVDNPNPKVPYLDIGGYSKQAMVPIITNEFSALADENDVEAALVKLREKWPHGEFHIDEHYYAPATADEPMKVAEIRNGNRLIGKGDTLAEALSAAMEGE